MVIALADITKSIGGKQIIQPLTLRINQGEVFALLGPNGAGKTTLVRLMLGLLKADTGKISLFNTLLTPATRADLLLKMGVQNDGNLYENLTVKENLSIWGEIYGLDAKQIAVRLDEMCAMFRLDTYLDMPVGSLSKGNRQKVLLARAMFHKPDILILDEPTTGLDPEAIDEFYGFITQLKKAGVTIMMCTHYLYGMDGLVDSIAILKQGKVLATGAVDDLRRADKQVQFYGQFRPEDVATLENFGRISGNQTTTFTLTVDRYQMIPDIVRLLSQQGNRIDEIHRKKESLKEIYFRMIGEN